jgi:hypothetical protein
MPIDNPEFVLNPIPKLKPLLDFISTLLEYQIVENYYQILFYSKWLD